MKPTREDLMPVVLAWSETIPFFPQSELGQATIINSVLQFVADVQHLNWFALFVVQNMPKWGEGGVPMLRALYSTKYNPADGQPSTFVAPGFSEDDLEAQYRRRELQENQRREDEFRQLAKSLPLENTVGPKVPSLPVAPFELPAGDVKLLPEPTYSDKREARQRWNDLAGLPDTEPTPVRSDAERASLVKLIESQLGVAPAVVQSTTEGETKNDVRSS